MSDWQKKERPAKTTYGRLPPYSEEAEAALLGCCLLDSKQTLGDVIAKLKVPEAFYDVRHQNIFRHLSAMHEHNEAIDQVTLVARVSVGDCEKEVGGVAYLAELPEKTPSAANATYYLEIVFEKYLARRYLKVCADATALLYDAPEGQPMSITLDQIEQSVFQVSQLRQSSAERDWKAVMRKSIDMLDDYHRGHGQIRGIATGFDYMDKMICGLQAGQLVVIAGRPATGKTSLGFNIVEHVTVDMHLPVGIFSLEMTAEELCMRSIFQRSGCDFQRFRTGFLSNSDIPKLIKATDDLSPAKIYLDDSGVTTIMDIRSKARRWQAEHGIKMLLIDYLQLVNGSGRFRERRDEVAEISKGLKALAKELSIPIVVLAQLNRDSEKEKRIPRMSDLGDSGAIERDADLIGILFAPILKKEEQELVDSNEDWAAHSRRINLQICKQRNGPTGPVEFLFQKASMRFVSYNRNGPNDEPETSNRIDESDVPPQEMING